MISRTWFETTESSPPRIRHFLRKVGLGTRLTWASCDSPRRGLGNHKSRPGECERRIQTRSGFRAAVLGAVIHQSPFVAIPQTIHALRAHHPIMPRGVHQFIGVDRKLNEPLTNAQIGLRHHTKAWGSGFLTAPPKSLHVPRLQRHTIYFS